jgi:hypothetical protein
MERILFIPTSKVCFRGVHNETKISNTRPKDFFFYSSGVHKGKLTFILLYNLFKIHGGSQGLKYYSISFFNNVSAINWKPCRRER